MTRIRSVARWDPPRRGAGWKGLVIASCAALAAGLPISNAAARRGRRCGRARPRHELGGSAAGRRCRADDRPLDVEGRLRTAWPGARSSAPDRNALGDLIVPINARSPAAGCRRTERRLDEHLGRRIRRRRARPSLRRRRAATSARARTSVRRRDRCCTPMSSTSWIAVEVGAAGAIERLGGKGRTSSHARTTGTRTATAIDTRRSASSTLTLMSPTRDSRTARPRTRRSTSHRRPAPGTGPITGSVHVENTLDSSVWANAGGQTNYHWALRSQFRFVNMKLFKDCVGGPYRAWVGPQEVHALEWTGGGMTLSNTLTQPARNAANSATYGPNTGWSRASGTLVKWSATRQRLRRIDRRPERSIHEREARVHVRQPPDPLPVRRYRAPDGLEASVPGHAVVVRGLRRRWIAAAGLVARRGDPRGCIRGRPRPGDSDYFGPNMPTWVRVPTTLGDPVYVGVLVLRAQQGDAIELDSLVVEGLEGTRRSSRSRGSSTARRGPRWHRAKRPRRHHRSIDLHAADTLRFTAADGPVEFAVRVDRHDAGPRLQRLAAAIQD